MPFAVRFFGHMKHYNEDRKQEGMLSEREDKIMLNKLRNVRIAAIVISIVFCIGVLGSLELEKLTIPQTLEYISVSAAFCGFIAAIEVTARFSKALITVYARRRRRKLRKIALKRTVSKRTSAAFAA